MNKTQKKQLDLLIELDRICKKHKIRYFLAGGTLIGAVRHKGFIPWDDDIDVEMLREDYDKFKEVCKKELNSKYFYQDMETDPFYGYLYAKLRINNTEYVEEVCVKNKAHCGIFLDVFPLDSYKTESTFDFKVVLFLRMLLLLKHNYIIKADSLVKKIEVIILKIIKTFTPKKLLIGWINRIIKKNRGGNKTKYLMSYGDIVFDKTLLQRKWYTKQKEFVFEGHKFTGTYYYDEDLTFLYGDYMTLPPEEKRVTHGIIKIKYDD